MSSPGAGPPPHSVNAEMPYCTSLVEVKPFMNRGLPPSPCRACNQRGWAGEGSEWKGSARDVRHVGQQQPGSTPGQLAGQGTPYHAQASRFECKGEEATGIAGCK
jgi:hypothetical protein